MGKHKKKAKNFVMGTPEGKGNNHGGAYASYTDYSSYSQFDCNHPDQPVMQIGNAHIWAGPAGAMEGTTQWDFRLRFTENLFSMPRGAVVRANPQAQAILPEMLTDYNTCPTLDLVWDDFGTPEVDPDWWYELVDFFKEKMNGHVAIYCYGGHGRTGTALAILAAIGGVVPQGDPVAWVRKNYCQKAVESAPQVRYIKYVTGRQFQSKEYEWINTMTTKPHGNSHIDAKTSMFAGNSNSSVQSEGTAKNPSWDSVTYEKETNTTTVVHSED